MQGGGSSNLPVPTNAILLLAILTERWVLLAPTHEGYLEGGTNSFGSDDPGPKK